MEIIKSAFGKLGKKFNKGYEFYLSIYLIINVIWLFLGMLIYNYFNFGYQNFSTVHVVFLIFNVLIILFLNLFHKVKFDKIDVFLILLCVFGFISFVFAENKSVALYGYYLRYEGLLQLFYYYSLMYLSSLIYKDKSKSLIINFILVFGFINALICLIQVFDVLKFIPINFRGTRHGMGLITHFNFYGSYMVLCMGLSLGRFLYCEKKSSWIYLFLFLIFYSSMLVCNTLSAVVGLGFICLFIFVYFIYSLFKKNSVNVFKYVLFFVISVLISLGIVMSGKTGLFKDVKKLSVETTEVAKGNFNDSYGTSRMFIWKNTLRVVPKYLLHGAGVDNLCFAFGEKMLYMESPTTVTYVDKAHNEYLQKLVCEGVFSCITYIGMLFIIFLGSVKRFFKEKNYIIMSLFLAFFGYCIQAFFNISVIEIAPIFWIICGLLITRKCKVL